MAVATRPVTNPLQAQHKVSAGHAESSQTTHRLFLAAHILEFMFTQRRQRNFKFCIFSSLCGASVDTSS